MVIGVLCAIELMLGWNRSLVEVYCFQGGLKGQDVNPYVCFSFLYGLVWLRGIILSISVDYLCVLLIPYYVSYLISIVVCAIIFLDLLVVLVYFSRYAVASAVSPVGVPVRYSLYISDPSGSPIVVVVGLFVGFSLSPAVWGGV